MRRQVTGGVLREGKRQRSLVSVVTALAMLLSVVLSGLALPTAAFGAANGDQLPAFIDIEKYVDKAELSPGETFTYSITVKCQQEDCVNATQVDVIPSELEGFRLLDADFTPSDVPAEVLWSEGETQLSEQPERAGEATQLRVNFKQQLKGAEEVLGLVAGTTFTVTLTFKVPEEFPPGKSGPITNTVTATADNSAPVSDSAQIEITSPVSTGVTATKAWAPAKQDYNPGFKSTIRVSAQNASNVSAERLVLQDPKVAVTDAAEFDGSNPFNNVDFAGFGEFQAPVGVTAVKVDAYVQRDGRWIWVEGEESLNGKLQLPSGVENADVAGIRVTGAGEIGVGETISYDFEVAQREADRSGKDLSADEVTLNNTVEATVHVPEQAPKSADAGAKITIIPVKASVGVVKDIVNKDLTAGESTPVTITASNGNDPVKDLKVTDLSGFFNEKVTFQNWDQAPTWPQGAAEGTLTYRLLSGGTQSVQLEQGALPVAPQEAISGFELEFVSGTDQTIAANAVAALKFTVGTTEDVTGDREKVTLTNRVQADVTPPVGVPGSANDESKTVVTAPGIDVKIDKTVRPGTTPVDRGQSVLVGLAATASATTDKSKVNEIVIKDKLGSGANEFWDAFNLTSVAPTQVPSGTALEVRVLTKSGWKTVSTVPALPSTHVVELTQEQINDELAPETASDVTGIEFVFTNESGFAEQVTVRPTLAFQARGELRSGGGPTSPEGKTQTYVNSAVADSTGTSMSGTPLVADQAKDTGEAQIQLSKGGPGLLSIEKEWKNKNGLTSLSSAFAETKHSWRVLDGFTTVEITDPADPTEVIQDSVFDAFNLVGINPISASNEPFTNGWYLKYDNIDAITLYTGQEEVVVSAPQGGWIDPSGRFVGYTLSAQQQQSVTGFKITLSENTQARKDAKQIGDKFDAFAPEPGTGVASSVANRNFELNWQLRDTKRSNGDWVVQDKTFNLNNETGTVNNTTRITGTDQHGENSSHDAADSIGILDQPPLVAVTKKVSPAEDVYTPVMGSEIGKKGERAWTITANNNSDTRATFVRVTDPANCESTALEDCGSANTATAADANPFADLVESDKETVKTWLADTMFDEFTATKVTIAASKPEQVDLDKSVVWVLKYADGGLTPQSLTVSEANAKDAEFWAEVVGVSVTFRSPDAIEPTITNSNKLTIKFDTVLRTHERASGSVLVLPAGKTELVTNRVFAQSYTPLLGEEAVANGAVANAQVTLTGGILEVNAAKSISPAGLARPTADTPVTVTLGANGGNSTLSPERVVIEDHADSADFWDRFDFAGIESVTHPKGAELVKVSVFGTFAGAQSAQWLDGTPQTGVELPVSEDEYPSIEGLRFTFTTANGNYFSEGGIDGRWDAEAKFAVQLRETLRGTGTPVAFSGEYENAQTTTSSRLDQEDVTATATDKISLSEGTHKLQVNKLTNNGNRLGEVGKPVPFELKFKNNGTGYLTITDLTDQIPAELLYLSEQPTYATSEGGTLATDGIAHEVQENGELVFTWPDGKNVMQPGEQFTIRLQLELQPLSPATPRAVNTMVVHTGEELDTCGNLTSQGLTGDWEQNKNSCGTSDYVEPKEGPNLFAVKGVRGSLEAEHGGAYQLGNPQVSCAPTLDTAEGKFFRTPCIAHSEVDGTDDWVLSMRNAGTIAVAEMIIFDQLPVAGDQMLIGAKSRNSQYRPQLVGPLTGENFIAPEGTTFRTEVTYSENVCNNTWNDLLANDPCANSGEEWFDSADADVEWAKVSGLRITADFSGAEQGLFLPGQTIEVHYSSINVLSSEADESGTSREVPAADQLAINQFGIKYRNANSDKTNRLTPGEVGVHLRTGSLEVQKVIDGPAAEHGPENYFANVVCTHGGTELDLGDSATVKLNEGNGLAARIDGIPLGSDCVISEQGEVGKFGETSRAQSNTEFAVTVPNEIGVPTEEQPVPEAQTAVLTNTYEFGSLSLTKSIDTLATVGTPGPFEFDLVCEHLGEQVFKVSFTLSADNLKYSAPENTVVVGADCLITETDSGNADAITITGAEPALDGDGEAISNKGHVTTSAEKMSAEVLVTNSFSAGTLAVTKELGGEGSDRFGKNTFTVTAECEYNGEKVYTGEVSFKAGETKIFLEDGEPVVLPSGAVCGLAETETGGANRTEFPATVQIAGGETTDVVGSNEFDIVNIFNVGNVAIQKVETGEGVDRFGGNDYTVRLECTYDVDGKPTMVEWDGQDYLDVTLTKDADYRHLETGIIEGADCRIIRESATGGSNGQDVGSNVTVIANGLAEEPVELDVTNTFNVGDVAIQKVETGGGADRFGGSDYTVRLECTYDVDGTETVVEWDGQDYLDVTLTKDAGYRHVETGIIEGADCRITQESATGGANSEHLGEPVTIVASNETQAQPKITVTNTFDVGSVTVSKVEAGGGVDRFGGQDYTVRLECSYDVDGEVTPVIWGDNEYLDVELTRANKYTATVDNLLVGTDCAVSEELQIGGSTAQDFGETVKVVAAGTFVKPAAITVTNTFNVGSIEINKVIAGDGADRFGTADYTVRLECTYGVDDQTRNVLWNDNPWLDVELTAENDYQAVVDELLVGAECAVTEELINGGANEVDLALPVLVVQGGLEEPQTLPSIDVVNTFNVGAIEIIKDVVGDGAQRYGNGNYTVRLECSYVADGNTVAVTWDDNTFVDVELNPGNGFRQTIDGLIVGADCAVTQESVTGGANLVDLGEKTVVVAAPSAETEEGEETPEVAETAAITVTNTFNVGSVVVEKVLEGPGAHEHLDQTFTVRLECVYDADGTETNVLWVGVPYLDIDLHQENDFTTEVDQLLSGAECAIVEETETGGAATVDLGASVFVVDGTQEASVITVTNSFDAVGKPSSDGPDALSKTGVNAALPVALVLLLLAGGALIMRKPRTGNRRAA